MTVFYTFAGAVIAVLSVIAAYYLWLLFKQKQQIKAFNDQQALEQVHKRHKVNNSIQVLAKGVLQGQLSLTEASIRISTLLDSLSVSEETRKDYIAFYRLAEQTSHIPILAAWKKLSRKEQFKYDLERQELEHQLADDVLLAAKKIADKTF